MIHNSYKVQSYLRIKCNRVTDVTDKMVQRYKNITNISLCILGILGQIFAVTLDFGKKLFLPVSVQFKKTPVTQYQNEANKLQKCNRVTSPRGTLYHNSVFLILCLVIILTSCSPIVLEGNSVTVRPGQKVVVRLELDWKTQDKWVVEKYDPELLRLESVQQMDYVDPSQATVQASTSTATFTALKPGASKIIFCKKKIWVSNCTEETTREIICR